MMRQTLVLLIGALVVSCGSAESLGQTIVASSPGTVTPGAQRILTIVADEDQSLVGGPDQALRAVLLENDSEEAIDSADTEWVWAIEDVRGFYAATLEFPSAGVYRVRLEGDGLTTEPGTIQIVDDTGVPGPGDSAPQSVTRTSDDLPLESITTDTDPDPSFYDTTVAEAVTSGRPSVIVFATPAFCQTASCGPTLDVVKEVAAEHPDVDFVHVEVFENIDDPQGELIPVPAVSEWGLLTEPWAFVVDSDGIVRAAFEGAVGDFEIERALSGL